ncbi:MAG: mitochondrial fission ELM1 family protein [gamma proteobacterium symbiont of Bathyaustriella thionipta]|nr:mitochondrial fission ELM1 family protein [gamma proteobacterium symbiont of Bathyaustriella thionipta]
MPFSKSDQSLPLVWLLSSHKAGECSQLKALASALAWPFKHIQLSHERFRLPLDLARLSGLHGLDANSRKALKAPWPDVILCAGVRSEPVSRWIKKQSGGKAKIVLIGSNWAHYRHFDLIISTPQYRLPERSNILHNHMTLHCIKRHEALPANKEPVITVLVGGHSGPYTLGTKAALRLSKEINQLAQERHARLLISTSARTPAAVKQVLQQQCRSDKELFDWSKDNTRNPYLSYLQAADEIVVTGDSIAMLSEAVATGKPVHIFDLGSGKNAMQVVSGNKGGVADDDFRLSAFTYKILMRTGPQRLSRDIRLVHEWLIKNDYAVWLQPPYLPSGRQAPDETLATVARIQKLLATDE